MLLVFDVIEALANSIKWRNACLAAFPIDHLHPLGGTNGMTVVEPLANMVIEKLLYRGLHLVFRELSR